MKPKKYETDRELAAELLEFRQKHGLTNSELGRRLGESEYFISKYINDKLDRDPADFADRARNALAAFRARLEDATCLFPTSVTKNIAGRIEVARRIQDIMLIVGPSGEGKTCAARMFADANPGTIYVQLCVDQRDHKQVASAIFQKLELRSQWKGQCPKAAFVRAQLRASNRVIIIDEAHMLDGSGRQFMFNLNRETGCAVVLIGNPEILDRIRANEQQEYRLGVASRPELKPEEIPQVSQRVAAQFSDDDFAEEVSDLVAFIAAQPGRLRSVRKTVVLAYELATKNGTSPREALRDAHNNLVRVYMLPPD